MGLSRYQQKQVRLTLAAAAQKKPKPPPTETKSSLQAPAQAQAPFRPPPQPEKPRLVNQPARLIILSPAEREMATALAKRNALLDLGDSRWVRFKLGPPVRL